MRRFFSRLLLLVLAGVALFAVVRLASPFGPFERVGKILQQDSWRIEGKCAPTDDTLILINVLQQLWQHYPRQGYEPYAVGISFGNLVSSDEYAEQLFQPEPSSKLNGILDKLNMRYGKNTVYFGGAHNALSHAPMRIAFNHIPDLDIENDTVNDQELS